MGLIGAWLGSLTYGMPLVIMSPSLFFPGITLAQRHSHTYKGTISGAPNFAYDLCTTRIRHEDLADLDLSSWRVAFNGAEAVSPETLQHFAEHFAPFGFRDDTLMPHVYGLAENSVGLAFPPLKRQPKIDLISRKALQDQGAQSLLLKRIDQARLQSRPVVCRCPVTRSVLWTPPGANWGTGIKVGSSLRARPQPQAISETGKRRKIYLMING